jgi:hypothetical protein
MTDLLCCVQPLAPPTWRAAHVHSCSCAYLSPLLCLPQVQVKQEAWRAALNRAKGEKVLDDPKLLRKSLKKDQKRREKSGKVWQERKAAQQEQQDKRQAKRKENLAVRAQGKIQKKKEKREKKLLGAGFEGRKEGFIGDKGKAK